MDIQKTPEQEKKKDKKNIKNSFFYPDDRTKKPRFFLGYPDKIPVKLHPPRHHTRDLEKDDPDSPVYTAEIKKESKQAEAQKDENKSEDYTMGYRMGHAIGFGKGYRQACREFFGVSFKEIDEKTAERKNPDSVAYVDEQEEPAKEDEERQRRREFWNNQMREVVKKNE